MLNELKEILESLNDSTGVEMNDVFYGMCTKKDDTPWNYIVFNRAKYNKNGKNLMDFGEYYEIHFVHEEYIPEGYIYKAIDEIQKQSREKNCKLKQADGDIQFDYTKKVNTNMVVEIATVTFVHARRGSTVRS